MPAPSHGARRLCVGPCCSPSLQCAGDVFGGGRLAISICPGVPCLASQQYLLHCLCDVLQGLPCVAPGTAPLWLCAFIRISQVTHPGTPPSVDKTLFSIPRSLCDTRKDSMVWVPCGYLARGANGLRWSKLQRIEQHVTTFSCFSCIWVQEASAVTCPTLGRSAMTRSV